MTVSPEGSEPRNLSKKILIIEDNRDLAETLELMLHLEGCSTKTAHDGLDGWTAISEFKPDIVLCDIGLPRMDGYQIAQETRKRHEFDTIRLIAMSGYGQDEDIRRSMSSGFNAHLTKPVDPEYLLRLLAEN